MVRLRNQKKHRKIVQWLALAGGNAWLPGFVSGTIYQGPLKRLCLPGLNCYSCPGALGACPVGSLQNAFADPIQRISLYVLGFLILLGGLLGRFVCGWLCPFGLVQEGLHRIPGSKWQPDKRPDINRRLSFTKYFVLVIFVIAMPFIGLLLTGYGEPAFCKLICPSGTLMAGLPLLAANGELRQLIGWLFGWKFLLLLLVIGVSIKVFRPFCRYLCPLGAVYGLFNRISLYRVTIDPDQCDQCGQCTSQCPMGVPVPVDANGPDCIRCGECAAVCPQKAIHCGFNKTSRRQESDEKS